MASLKSSFSVDFLHVFVQFSVIFVQIKAFFYKKYYFKITFHAIKGINFL